MMDNNEYLMRIDQIRDYFSEFVAEIGEEYDKVCGVNCVAPRSIIDDDRIKKLEKSYPVSWKDAFDKMCLAFENFKKDYKTEYGDNEICYIEKVD